MTTYINPEFDYLTVFILQKLKKRKKRNQKSYTGIHPSTSKSVAIKVDILGVVLTSNI